MSDKLRHLSFKKVLDMNGLAATQRLQLLFHFESPRCVDAHPYDQIQIRQRHRPPPHPHPPTLPLLPTLPLSHQLGPDHLQTDATSNMAKTLVHINLIVFL